MVCLGRQGVNHQRNGLGECDIFCPIHFIWEPSGLGLMHGARCPGVCDTVVGFDTKKMHLALQLPRYS
jgi:hypothetical protein